MVKFCPKCGDIIRTESCPKCVGEAPIQAEGEARNIDFDPTIHDNMTGDELITRSFTRRDGNNVESAVNKLKGVISFDCFKCGLKIEKSRILALSKSYHLECFSCAECRKSCVIDGKAVFVEKNGNTVCESCGTLTPAKSKPTSAVVNTPSSQISNKAIGSKSKIPIGGDCQACKAPLTGSIIKVKDLSFHRNCFVCAMCNLDLTVQV